MIYTLIKIGLNEQQHNKITLIYFVQGDFAAVSRENRFRPITDVKDFIQRLEDEIAVQNVSSENVMGFIK